VSHSYDRTFLAIDYGDRRIGIAKSDPTGLIASAVRTLEVKSVKDALDQVLGLIKEFEPNGLVIGYPLHVSGRPSELSRKVDLFIEQLKEHYEGPIYKVDERYSSIEATDVIHAHGQRVGKDKRRIDRLAAVIILQRFLDEQSFDSDRGGDG